MTTPPGLTGTATLRQRLRSVLPVGALALTLLGGCGVSTTTASSAPLKTTATTPSTTSAEAAATRAAAGKAAALEAAAAVKAAAVKAAAVQAEAVKAAAVKAAAVKAAAVKAAAVKAAAVKAAAVKAAGIEAAARAAAEAEAAQAAAQAAAAAPAPLAALPAEGARDFANCTELKGVYPHGVGRPGAVDHVSGGGAGVTTFTVDAGLYAANSGSDRDGDGIACEQR